MAADLPLLRMTMVVFVDTSLPHIPQPAIHKNILSSVTLTVMVCVSCNTQVFLTMRASLCAYDMVV